MNEFGLRSHGDFRDILENVAMIRRNLGPNTLIEFHCYNRTEVDETSTLLTPEERKQVRFFWLTFPQPGVKP